jgi:hypothetical protein
MLREFTITSASVLPLKRALKNLEIIFNIAKRAQKP